MPQTGTNNSTFPAKVFSFVASFSRRYLTSWRANTLHTQSLGASSTFPVTTYMAIIHFSRRKIFCFIVSLLRLHPNKHLILYTLQSIASSTFPISIYMTSENAHVSSQL